MVPYRLLLLLVSKDNPKLQLFTSQPQKTDNAFPQLSAQVSVFNIGAPIDYAHSILHASDHLILRAIQAIHEINAVLVYIGLQMN